jgi:hypothetical protein
MKSIVVYESWFANTRDVAEAVADELLEHGEVQLLSVDDPLQSLDGVDLLVVGAPTHAHGLSSSMTRKSALQQRGSDAEAGTGVRGWLDRLPPADGQRAAAFDTRFRKSIFLTGSAARGIAKRLERRGYELAAPPVSFFVLDTAGPLEDGEIESAREWAKRLVGIPILTLV